MDRNSFHLAHTAATGASLPGLTVPDEFHEVSLGGRVTPKPAATELQYLIRMKIACSTEFPLKRLAVRGCERTMSGAKRRTSMKRSGTSEADFRTAATKKAGLPAVKFFMCGTYSENGLAGP